VKLSAEGKEVWKRRLDDFSAFDMLLLPDGRLILSGGSVPQAIPSLKMISITAEGKVQEAAVSPAAPAGNTFQIAGSASLSLAADGDIIISGGMHIAQGPGFFPYAMKINPDFKSPPAWNQSYNFFPGLTPPPNVTLGYIQPTVNNRFVFLYVVETIIGQPNSIYGNVMGLLNADGSLFSSKFTQTGSAFAGFSYSYGKLIPEAQGTFISWRSLKKIFLSPGPAQTTELLRLSADGVLKDSIPVSLPLHFMPSELAFNASNNFYMTASLHGDLIGSSEFTPQQTYFMKGSVPALSVSQSFFLQELNTEHFHSLAPTQNGSFIAFGQMQAFERPYYKPLLIKLKKP
jgi:hypothetical protein